MPLLTSATTVNTASIPASAAAAPLLFEPPRRLGLERGADRARPVAELGLPQQNVRHGVDVQHVPAPLRLPSYVLRDRQPRALHTQLPCPRR